MKDLTERMILILCIESVCTHLSKLSEYTPSMCACVKTQNMYLRFVHFIIHIFYTKNVDKY